ncbi:serine protease [Nanoarchaeota archaeon]
MSRRVGISVIALFLCACAADEDLLNAERNIDELEVKIAQRDSELAKAKNDLENEKAPRIYERAFRDAPDFIPNRKKLSPELIREFETFLSSQEVHNAVEDVFPNAVFIIRAESYSSETRSSTGNGYFITPHCILTNMHVVADQESMMSSSRGLGIICQDGNFVLDRIAMLSPKYDLALILTREPFSKFVPLSIGPNPQRGEVCYSIRITRVKEGFMPYCAFALAAGKIEVCANFSQFPETILLDPIMFSSPVTKGNSGSPLINEEGQLVGVTTFSTVRRRGTNYTLFASSASNIRRVVSEYLNSQREDSP